MLLFRIKGESICIMLCSGLNSGHLYIHSNEFQNGGWKQTWEDMDINTSMVNAMLTSFRRLDGLDNFL